MWHVIATKTVLPTLKNAREHCERPRTPQIMFSGNDPQALWHIVVKQIGAVLGNTNDVLECSRGLPIYVTGDWTYWLVQDANS